MNVLSIETSSRTVSVAYIDGETHLIERFLKQGHPSGGLLPLIDSVLKECKRRINDVDLFVVDTGPGSFTGIRVGISTVSGISYALSMPAIGVSSFEVIAGSLSFSHPIVVWIDTRQGDVYHAVLEHKRNQLEFISLPKAGRPEELLKDIKNCQKTEDRIVFAGDGAIKFRDLITAHFKKEAVFPECLLSHPSAGVLAMIGLKRFKEKGGDLDPLSPFYLRDFFIDKKLT